MIGIISNHYVAEEPAGDTGMFVDHIGSYSNGASALDATPNAASGDLQILAISTHATINPGARAGFTSVGSWSSAHSRLSLYTRILDSGTFDDQITLPNYDYSGRYSRVYRGFTTLTHLNNGSGFEAPSRAVSGRLLRFWSNARDNGSGGSPVHPLAADVNLLNRYDGSFIWFGGIAAGDDPVTSGTAPARTATGSALFPQWVDLELS